MAESKKTKFLTLCVVTALFAALLFCGAGCKEKNGKNEDVPAAKSADKFAPQPVNPAMPKGPLQAPPPPQ